MSTGIEWTDETWNPIRARNKETGGVGHFCEKVSPACRHCYAEVLQKRYFKNPIHYGPGDRDKVELFLDERTLLAPLKWKRPRMVFPCSMTDLFGEWVPGEWFIKIFGVMALSRRHTYQVLTKRPEHMANILMSHSFERAVRTMCEVLINQGHGSDAFRSIEDFRWPLPNVWLGTSVEDQQRADERIPHLLRCPAAVRWLSCEPLLGELDIHLELMPGGDYEHEPSCDKLHCVGSGDPELDCNGTWHDVPGIDWVVCGGESGPGFRSLNIDHARSLRDQCEAGGVSFFFKQVGGRTPKAGGRLLDGVVHDGMPPMRQKGTSETPDVAVPGAVRHRSSGVTSREARAEEEQPRKS